ncbi:phosphoribosylglycinamide formyltransferase [Salibacter sp.]|uniref:phosphoribosylglycinamide formyltransferase n=1 Tax=Salibacter sp. TaxID=2010995 RepID=UPI002870212E|nr:phosphoribosylglycinamide formyltransferase [Salibacter sp.]MDR9486721.1 phosphoribosylglycinamide formyltransferase [Salibacter sp.]
MKNIAILASGTGTNAAKIMDHFIGNPQIFVSVVASNNDTAGVLDEAVERGVPTAIFSNEQLHDEEIMLNMLHGIDLIVLAGFMRKIPPFLLEEFEDRIVNIHPALLPKFGGKGMYGNKVHEAVIEAGEKQTGITIHLVNEEYDEGKILFQESIPVKQTDTPESLAMRVQKLEHEHFPKIIQKLVRSL